MKKSIKIYGPPGTGKTFRLIKRVKAYVRTGTPLHKIGYFAFTKKAAAEAKAAEEEAGKKADDGESKNKAAGGRRKNE